MKKPETPFYFLSAFLLSCQKSNYRKINMKSSKKKIKCFLNFGTKFDFSSFFYKKIKKKFFFIVRLFFMLALLKILYDKKIKEMTNKTALK
jgi:hypothetical protein